RPDLPQEDEVVRRRTAGNVASRAYGKAYLRLRRLVDRRPRIFKVQSIGEQYPKGDNRVVLGRERDVFGMPRAEVEWRLDAEDIQGMAASQRRFGELLARAGI